MKLIYKKNFWTVFIVILLLLPSISYSLPIFEVRSSIGFRVPHGVTYSSIGGHFWVRNIGIDPLDFGRYDLSTNSIIEGDYVWAGFIDIGDAPLSANNTYNLSSWTSSPLPHNILWGDWSSFTLPSNQGTFTNAIDIDLRGTFDAQSPGYQGTMYLHLALLSNANMDINSAPGVVFPYELILTPDGSSGFIPPHENYYTSIQGGGAPIPEPTTMLLFGVGLLGIAGVGRSRKV